MSKKPETRYIDKVHRRLVKLYPHILKVRMSMMPGSTSGIADFLYENKHHVWVEYKHLPNFGTIRKLPVNKISSNQFAFLRSRVEKDIPCAVVFGDDKGVSYILSDEHILTPPTDIIQIRDNLQTPEHVATYINNICS